MSSTADGAVYNAGYCSRCGNRRPTRWVRFSPPDRKGSNIGHYCRRCEQRIRDFYAEYEPDEIIEYLDKDGEVCAAI